MNPDELIQDFIVLSTLIKALQQDSKSDILLVPAITKEALKPIQADLKRIEQQLWRNRIEVKKYPGQSKYQVVKKGQGPEVTTVVYTSAELKRLCEEKALSYINK